MVRDSIYVWYSPLNGIEGDQFEKGSEFIDVHIETIKRYSIAFEFNGPVIGDFWKVCINITMVCKNKFLVVTLHPCDIESNNVRKGDRERN